MATPEAIWASNLVKRVVIETIRTLTHPLFIPTLLCVLIFPRKKLFTGVINSFDRIGMSALQPYFIKEEYLTPCAKGLKGLIRDFLTNLDLPAENTAKILAHLIEYDAAYRFRLQDLLSETTQKRLIKNPRKELQRLNRINAEREIDNWPRERMNLVFKGISLLLLLPSIKKAFIMAVQNTDLTLLQLDEGDRYWVSYRKNYNFMGLTYEDRQLLI